MSNPRQGYKPASHQSAWRAPALAWALYDFAYSIFIFLFGVRFFSPWIIDQLHRPDWYVGVTQAAAVVAVLFLMPLAGVLADQLGRRKPFLLAFTLAACGGCATLGVLPITGSVVPALVVAGITFSFGQLAFAQFDPLLADVSRPATRGRISGLAVSLGFVGIVFGLAVVGGLVVGEGSKQRAFFPTALLYFVFALPALALVRERRDSARSVRSLRIALPRLGTTLRHVRQHRTAFQFLVGRFLYSDAIVTLGTFLAVYMTRVGGFSDQGKNLVIGTGVLAAAAGALVAGRLVERVGPKRPLLNALPAFSLALMISAIVGEPWTIWLAAPVSGIALGFVWTADRVFMLELAPPELRGQFFALFNLANRTASALGPLIVWSGTVWLLHERTGWLSALGASRVAVAGLAGTAALGWAVIRPLADPGGSFDASVQHSEVGLRNS